MQQSGGGKLLGVVAAGKRLVETGLCTVSRDEQFGIGGLSTEERLLLQLAGSILAFCFSRLQVL